MSLQIVARGQTIAVLDSLGLPHPTVAKALRYWIDDDAGSVTTVDIQNGKYTLDVSTLLEGLHILHCQIVDDENQLAAPSSEVFMMMPATSTTQAGSLRYWFDNDANVMTCDANAGVKMLDASTLIEGLHTLHCQVMDADGKTSYVTSDIFMKPKAAEFAQDIAASNLIYWFDDEETTSTVEMNDGMQILDTSDLLDGLHTIHYMVVCNDGSITTAYSSIFLRMSVESVASKRKNLRYWFDDELSATEIELSAGVQALDASHLIEGIHTVHCQLIDENEMPGVPTSQIFLKVDEQETASAQSLRYWFDDETDIKTIEAPSGEQILDVSGLLAGLHTLHYQLTDDRGIACTPVSGLFMKMFDKVVDSGENVITNYTYWVNEHTTDNTKVVIDKPASPYQLFALLPMIKAPIRSSCFHFEVTDGVPMLYAKNDLHVRFEDAMGYWVDESRSFVDYAMAETITDITNLQTTQTFDRVAENSIKWFAFEAASGDTIAFRCSQATSLQVFTPSGKEIYAASGDKSVVFDGTHTWEEGTYYVAVHDVTGSRFNVTLDYMHMDKYDVVSQDVRVVGNGGCSTITFQGNGFRDLYDVVLYTEQGEEIHAIDIGHESDASTSVTFDFTGAEIGMYNALFHFTEEDKTFADNISVEEAIDIELATKVSYPSTFLRGSSVTYTVEIANKGNMTAYMVPMELKLIVDNVKNVQDVKFNGYLSSLTMPDFSELADEDIKEIRQIVESSNDLSQFIIYRDSIMGKDYGFAQAIMSLPPNSTKTFTVNLKSTTNVHLEAWTTNNWFPISFTGKTIPDTESIQASTRESMCCMKDKVECIAESFGKVAELFMPPGAKCVSSLSLTGLETVYDVWCSEGSSISERWNNYLKSEGYTLANRLTQSVVTCIIGYYKVRQEALIEERVKAAKLGNTAEVERITAEIVDCRTAKMSTVSNIYNGITTMFLGKNCIEAFTTTKPNCPPNPSGGGGISSPVNSRDPNDIFGYIAQSGSKFLSNDIADVPYRIEFENDTTFATASAHTVIVKDTLDATLFDLSSYRPTSIKIGEKNVQLKGDKQFVTTVDMRPAINAIAQVEGLYDEQKGIASWQFTSLDPMTMEPTDDVMQGFLPVNNDGISGIGEVAFDIALRQPLADGTEIPNRASIVFDSNEPILTPTWTNIVDAVAPVGSVIEVTQHGDSAIIVCEGTDERSGVWKYEVYTQPGVDAPWLKVGECYADSTMISYEVFDGLDYGFCALAVDSAGNVEQKELVRELSLMPDYTPGDVNGDHSITYDDVAGVVSLMLHTNTSGLSSAAADVNEDGEISISDAVLLINMIKLASPKDDTGFLWLMDDPEAIVKSLEVEELDIETKE